MSSKLISLLNAVLADSYILLLKTHNYHWNITGTNFYSFHQMLETQYTDLFEAVDLIAERIRARHEKAMGSFEEYKKITNISEGNANAQANDMILDIAKDQDIIIATLSKAIEEASKENDDVTAGILSDRIEVHQKNAWMLNASCE